MNFDWNFSLVSRFSPLTSLALASCFLGIQLSAFFAISFRYGQINFGCKLDVRQFQKLLTRKYVDILFFKNIILLWKPKSSIGINEIYYKNKYQVLESE